MSVYDNRDVPAYQAFDVPVSYSDNPYILCWWTQAHDRVLADLISEWHWAWYWRAKDAVVEITPNNLLEVWKKDDPLCSDYAWYNVLTYFSVSRAKSLGLTAKIRKPLAKTCLICSEIFVEDSLPQSLIERLGIDRLEFCAPCLRDTVLQNTGSTSISKHDTAQYLRDLSDLLGRVPAQGFGEGVGDLQDMETQERVMLLRLLRNKPSTKTVKAAFGSWLNALIQAGILADGTRRTSRGTQTIARDGHVCFSLGEKTIDDWLYLHGVPHVREPKYPEGNYRGDFLIGQTMVEYFGLAGDPAYDKKIRKKERICEKYGVKLVAIYPRDLAIRSGLHHKLASFLKEGGYQAGASS